MSLLTRRLALRLTLHQRPRMIARLGPCLPPRQVQRLALHLMLRVVPALGQARQRLRRGLASKLQLPQVPVAFQMTAKRRKSSATCLRSSPTAVKGMSSGEIFCVHVHEAMLYQTACALAQHIAAVTTVTCPLCVPRFVTFAFAQEHARCHCQDDRRRHQGTES